jgi:hypothetical protein
MTVFEEGTALVAKVRSADGRIQTKELLDVCRSILPIVGEQPNQARPLAAAAAASHCRHGAHRWRTTHQNSRECLWHCVVRTAEKLGTGFALVKHDVGGNIDRLAACAATKPAAYEPDAFQMVLDDVAAGTHTASSSVTKGLLWLKRCVPGCCSTLPGWCAAVHLPQGALAMSRLGRFPPHPPRCPACSHSAMEFIVALLDRLYTDRQVSLATAASETYYATLQRYHGWIVTGTFTVALKLVPSRCLWRRVEGPQRRCAVHDARDNEGTPAGGLPLPAAALSGAVLLPDVQGDFL